MAVEPARSSHQAKLRVGLIGNFAHTANVAAAEALLRSPLAADPAIEIVLAGVGSERWMSPPHVFALGAVDSPGAFYDRIDASVVPVSNGSGMKTKIAEAILAGKAVVTTTAGAAGFPPALRGAFSLITESDGLTVSLVETAVRSSVEHSYRDAFAAVFERRAAEQGYAEALMGLLA